MQRSRLAKRVWFLLLAAAAVTMYLYGLGRAPLVGPDEPRYAQVAREMFIRGDLVTPMLGGETWFEKPALLYWLMMASFSIFGVSEWSARLGAAAAGLLTVVFVSWLARGIERATANGEMGLFGLASTAVTISSAGLIVFSRAASFDIILTASIALALACFLSAELEEEKRRRRRLLAGFYIGIGASLLAKGLVGIVIPVCVVVLYSLLRRRRPDPGRLGVMWGVALALAVAGLWYGPVIARHGFAFVDEFFVQHHFARYVSNRYRHPQPFYFYIPIMLLLALPWTAFLVAALAGARHWTWRGEDVASKLRIFSFAWLVVPVAFFSVSGSKLPGYILPALPGAALLAGDGVARFLRGESGGRALRATGALILALCLGGLVFGARTGLITNTCLFLTCFPAGVAGALALGFTRRRGVCIASIVAAALLTVTLIVECAVNDFARRESVHGLLQSAAARGYATTPVFQLHTIERTAEFYAAGRLAYDERGEPVKFEGVPQVAEAARRAGGRALVIVPLEYVWQLSGATSLRSEMIGDNGAVALVAVETD